MMEGYVYLIERELKDARYGMNLYAMASEVYFKDFLKELKKDATEIKVPEFTVINDSEAVVEFDDDDWRYKITKVYFDGWKEF